MIPKTMKTFNINSYGRYLSYKKKHQCDLMILMRSALIWGKMSNNPKSRFWAILRLIELCCDGRDRWEGALGRMRKSWEWLQIFWEEQQVRRDDSGRIPQSWLLTILPLSTHWSPDIRGSVWVFDFVFEYLTLY